MHTDRRFAAFYKMASPPRMKEVPEGGMCLSAFLVISKTGQPNEVLMGRLNKNAPWDHIGALDPDRVERHSKGWMLPSSHLILCESPQEAAQRILREQLGLTGHRLEEPLVFSEAYGSVNHWDIEFIFLGETGELPTHGAWSELRFVDLPKTKKEEIARSHEDILAHVGKWKPTNSD